jgi:hypothetical protein
MPLVCPRLPRSCRSDYTYLEHFKLSLHEGSGQELPADLTPVQVVADSLGLMRRCAAWLHSAVGWLAQMLYLEPARAPALH